MILRIMLRPSQALSRQRVHGVHRRVVANRNAQLQSRANHADHTAVLSKTSHANCCTTLTNRPSRGRRGRFVRVVQQLAGEVFERSAVFVVHRPIGCYGTRRSYEQNVPFRPCSAEHVHVCEIFFYIPRT